MSNELAVAAVTRTLSDLLGRGLKGLKEREFPNKPTGDVSVTTLPLDEANDLHKTKNALNLFMYRSEISAAWRNAELPGVNRPNEGGFPPLALNLHYLLTAYGEKNGDQTSHLFLGTAMSVLHDHPLLGRQEIEKILKESGLHEQVERVRITPEPLSLDDMSKLWSAFQSSYRPSTAYAVAVVLIESTLTAHAALPVLTRGRDDGGVFVLPTRAPVLTAVTPPRSQPSARLGEDLLVAGEGLDVAGLVVRMTNPRLTAPLDLEPTAGGTAAERRVHLPAIEDEPDAMAAWTPGFYVAEARTHGAGTPETSALTSNQVAWALAPRIGDLTIAKQGQDATITLTCAPRLREGQRVILLLTPAIADGGAERQVPPSTITTPADQKLPTTVVFTMENTAAGKYVVRLRIDGVDSLPVVRDGNPPRPRFDEAQMVTVP